MAAEGPACPIIFESERQAMLAVGDPGNDNAFSTEPTSAGSGNRLKTRRQQGVCETLLLQVCEEIEPFSKALVGPDLGMADIEAAVDQRHTLASHGLEKSR
jgi:hypothetical protein